jgi:hypothetical protein
MGGDGALRLHGTAASQDFPPNVHVWDAIRREHYGNQVGALPEQEVSETELQRTLPTDAPVPGLKGV